MNLQQKHSVAAVIIDLFHYYQQWYCTFNGSSSAEGRGFGCPTPVGARIRMAPARKVPLAVERTGSIGDGWEDNEKNTQIRLGKIVGYEWKGGSHKVIEGASREKEK